MSIFEYDKKFEDEKRREELEEAKEEARVEGREEGRAEIARLKALLEQKSN